MPPTLARVAVLASVLLLARSSPAAPHFEAVDADLSELAQRVWRSGVACTGWEPAHAAEVPIAEAELDWANGAATLNDRGLSSIRLSPHHGPWTHPTLALPHEVAHAWSHSTSSGLSEGTAEVLAECIAQRLGLNTSTGPALPELVLDLRTWKPEAAGSAEQRSAGYELARRFARARLLLFGPEALWGQAAPSNLDQLRVDLRARGRSGAHLLALLDAPTALRDFLLDRDHDDVPDGVEALLGTDPERWDSDGDGWWDGAQIADREGLTPLPPSRDPVCLPAADGFELRDGPVAWTRSLEQWTGDRWVPWLSVGPALPPARVVRRGQTALYWSGWGGRGGSWLVPRGQVAVASCADEEPFQAGSLSDS